MTHWEAKTTSKSYAEEVNHKIVFGSKDGIVSCGIFHFYIMFDLELTGCGTIPLKIFLEDSEQTYPSELNGWALPSGTMGAGVEVRCRC